MQGAQSAIPKELIYEMVNGHPIYYKGFRDYLAGTKTLGQIMGSSKFQSFLAAELVFLIRTLLGNRFFVFSNEIGLQFSKKSWRAADIAVIQKSKLIKLDHKYLDLPPDFVIEIDTKADLKEIQNPLGYYQEKTQELLNFGVKKIVWIFTDTQKIMIAEANQKSWQILDWDQEVALFEGLSVHIQALIDESGLS